MDKKIGKFKVVREIGKGGMGVVYKALDPEAQNEVAIKVLPAAKVDKAMVERFSREAHAMSRLKHPNLVAVYDVGMSEGQHFYTMEFIEGDSLKTIVKNKGKLPFSDCLRISAQIADALACIHAEGMIHRDIKPANIMVTADGEVKLMDFGLVQIADVTRVTVEGASVGTAEYMSPEQISEDEIDSRSDIYSLGATMYEMVTGRPPFEGDNLQSILMKHKYEKPPALRSLRPDAPPALEQIVHKALAKDVSQRYQKILDLVKDLNAIGGFSLPRRQEKDAGRETKQAEPAPATRPEPSPSSRLSTAALKRPGFRFSWPPLIFLLVVGLAVAGYLKKDKLPEYIEPILSKIPFLSKQPVDLTNEAQGYLGQFQAAENHYSRGHEYYRKAQLGKAIEEYRRAIELRPDYALYYKELAEIYEYDGQEKKAVKTWQDLLEYAPESSYARQAQQAIDRLTQ